MKINVSDVKVPEGYVIDKKTKVFSVIFVDTDDAEDSKVEIWVAKNERHLESSIEKEMDAPEGYFDESWGTTIIAREIGTI